MSFILEEWAETERIHTQKLKKFTEEVSACRDYVLLHCLQEHCEKPYKSQLELDAIRILRDEILKRMKNKNDSKPDETD